MLKVIVSASGSFKPRIARVISPLLANLYLHWFDKLFHRSDGPYCWANARLVRYADDFVIMARYVGDRIETFVGQWLQGRFGLKVNADKTRTVNLNESGGSLDFWGTCSVTTAICKAGRTSI